MTCEKDKVDVTGLAVITVVGSVVCLVIAFGVAALLYDAEANVNADYAKAESPAAPIKASQRAGLEKYRTLDSDKGVYAVPIERAMDLIVEENANK